MAVLETMGRTGRGVLRMAIDRVRRGRERKRPQQEKENDDRDWREPATLAFLLLDR